MVAVHRHVQDSSTSLEADYWLIYLPVYKSAQC